jgi:hypothetical protein
LKRSEGLGPNRSSRSPHSGPDKPRRPDR